MVNLGLLNEDGRGVAQDYGTAGGWYGKAAVYGNSDAQAALDRLKAIAR